MRSTVSLLGLFAGLVVGTCYRLDGQPYSKIRPDDGDWVACNPGATVSTCCSEKDYCLGNGLCLDASANNFFSIQGCTDSSWSGPCITSQTCKDNIKDEYSFIWACGQKTDADFNYCCGETAACCANTTSLITLKGATAISRPGALSTTSSIPSGSATPPSSQSSQPATSNPVSSDGKMLGIILGVALGVGVPLIAALVFFAWQLRKSRVESRRPMSIATEPYQPSTTPFSPKATTPIPQAQEYYYQPIGAAARHDHTHGPPELHSREVLQQLSELQ